MKREKGFYWIKYYSIWIVAEWTGRNWYTTGSDQDINKGVREVIENRLTPPKQ